jgi:hypothetical protein
MKLTSPIVAMLMKLAGIAQTPMTAPPGAKPDAGIKFGYTPVHTNPAANERRKHKRIMGARQYRIMVKKHRAAMRAPRLPSEIATAVEV